MQYFWLEYIPGEKALTHLVSGLPSWGLLALLMVCIVMLSNGGQTS